MKLIIGSTLVLLLFVIAQAAPDIAWTKIYGGPGVDAAYAFQQTPDSGFIVTGITESFSGIWLLKTDKNGDTLWTKSLGSGYVYAAQDIQIIDDGYIIVANTRVADIIKIYLIKTDLNGNVIWTRILGASDSDDSGWSVKQTYDGYVITGITYRCGTADLLIMKTDLNGDTLWSRAYGSNIRSDIGYNVQVTSDSAYIVAGFTESYSTWLYHAWLLKINPNNGDTLWTHHYAMGDARFVQQTPDGGYILAGRTPTSEVIWDGYLIKTDPNGNTIWAKRYDWPGLTTHCGGRDDEFYCVDQTSDGGYILVGNSREWATYFNEALIVRTDSYGNILWDRIWGGHFSEYPLWVKQTYDRGYVLAGVTYSFGGGDAFIIKIEADEFGITENECESPDVNFCLKNNPSRGKALFCFTLPKATTINLQVYDALGRMVNDLSESKSSGYHEILWGSNVPSGIYFYKFRTPWNTEIGKLVLVR